MQISQDEEIQSFTYSKKSHFQTFKNEGLDVELYGGPVTLEENGDLLIYQELLVYHLLKNSNGKKILVIGDRNLVSAGKLSEKNEYLKIDSAQILSDSHTLKFRNIADEEIILNHPNGYFDFIYFSSMNNVIPADQVSYKKLTDNAKKLIAVNGIMMASFMNIFLFGDVWRDEMFNHMIKTEGVVNEIKGYRTINHDDDLFYINEKYYNKYWKEHTGKDYKDFGKAFCYIIFIRNTNQITKKKFSDFIYSKDFHQTFFQKGGYINSLFGKYIPDLTSVDLNCLTVYSYILSNFKKGSKILQIDDVPEVLEKKLSAEYDLYKIKNVSDLSAIQFNSEKIERLSDHDGIKGEEDFDAAYSINGFNKVKEDPFICSTIINNVEKLLINGGEVFLANSIKIFSDYMVVPWFLDHLLNHNIFRLDSKIKLRNYQSYKDLKFISKTGHSGSENEIPHSKEFCFNVLWKKVLRLPTKSETPYHHNLEKHPVYVFHHLMKCGGTSLFFILDKWFKTVDDNILLEDLNVYTEKKFNTEIFHNDVCIRAHFQRPGIFLHERYPEFISEKKSYKIFTFIRDPLAVAISKYYFLLKINAINKNYLLKDVIMGDKNFLAGLFPCDESNYKEVIDRYYFVGVVERLQESFDILADMIGKKKETIPYLNITEKDNQVKELTSEDLKKFKEVNALDYKIYDYCLEKFNSYKSSEKKSINV